MARMPGVYFQGLGYTLMSRRDIVVLHTIVGYQSGGTAAHFTTGADGEIIQCRDTGYESIASLHGNWHTIAIENEDTGPAYKWVNGAVPRFTAAQAEAIAKILVWCHKQHDIPLALVPDSKVGRRGIAYHRQGIPGNFVGPYKGMVSGGELWSSSFGKVCPGDARIHQLIEEILPRARQLANPTVSEEDDDVKPRLCRYIDSNVTFVVTPAGHWKLPATQTLQDFAHQWEIPATVEAHSRTAWFGPRLDLPPAVVEADK